ncbi:nitroreductase family deazaflavin-dependent oxidoreductase [Cryobacterium sp. TMT2-10]|uniref:Nitroreductase family deazaflavin-dependent oxidoreductase n=1 Tax=Cryobacterium shii TaxID=1259235 RepID=A0AAQ2HGU2_9MICO|nr:MULTISPECIES: nitroreductase family deazaflavin-dependent oxidoreductase [Cryobacterium]TFC52367.1 nitroreductase family deazaflavin-dependent oxidoreductase [Cryobacterium shii]TFC87517.1 nitroreductase family deazaflavin-dependent oxidoreductase [Cryobacterium sp. TmT2-59]TFD16528.1 nitroreductase family deazaflavin-dependent oxidoreductase [Cryobacterium sp. TMT2-23]TFD20496.1 nitroreductase family deazaflavin-dependent oxidoreductase [Cryobacterium sp. TMT4-10]TFD35220.1 nitroreductase 
MGMRNRLVDLQMKTMSALHLAVLRATGGRVLSSIGSMPAVELHTIGRSSGKRRTTMLTAPVHGHQRFVLIASKGGDDRHPQWYLNLVANPDVELTVHGSTLKLRARTATTEEKAELWPQIVAAYRGYDGYQQKTSRDIPVVICEPRSR